MHGRTNIRINVTIRCFVHFVLLFYYASKYLTMHQNIKDTYEITFIPETYIIQYYVLYVSVYTYEIKFIYIQLHI